MKAFMMESIFSKVVLIQATTLLKNNNCFSRNSENAQNSYFFKDL